MKMLGLNVPTFLFFKSNICIIIFNFEIIYMKYKIIQKINDGDIWKAELYK